MMSFAMRKPNQKLLTLQDDVDGKCIIKRGSDGEGYFIAGTDNALNVNFDWLPLTQDCVAKFFKEKGLDWRFE